MIPGAPTAAVGGGRGVVEIVGREVLDAAGVVVDAIALNASRIHPQLEGGVPVVARVEEDGEVVVRPEDLIAVHVRGTDLLGMGVVAAYADVEVAVVIEQPGGRLGRRGRVGAW